MRQLQAMIIAAAAAFPAAAGPIADFRPLGEDDQPLTADAGAQVRPSSSAAPVGTVIEHAPALAVHRSSGVNRGMPLSMTDDLENLEILPAILRFQLGNPIWSDASITGRNRWLATTVAGRSVGAVTDPVAGNNSIKVRVRAETEFEPELFFFGFRYELLRSNTPQIRLQLGPGADTPGRLEHDFYYDDALVNQHTSEPANVGSGYITARLIFGGECPTGCGGVLPITVYDRAYVLGTDPDSYLTGVFVSCYWQDTAPANASPGDLALVPAATWVRMRWDHAADGRVQLSLNYNDGTGFHVCYDGPFLTGLRFDSLAANGSFTYAGHEAYYDNIAASGVEVVLPYPPTALECGHSGYIDDAQWLLPGPLKDQNAVWFDALSSKANVDVVNGDYVIRQTTYFADDLYREEFTRTLPDVIATPGNPWLLCEEIRIDGGVDGAATVRGVSLVSFLENSFVTRVAFGHYDPEASPPYTDRIFVQHNPAYDPYDDHDTESPYVAGPDGNGGVARIGGAATIGDPNFDYYDTGVSFLHNEARLWCVEVQDDGAMTVMYDGIALVGGDSDVTIDPFATSLSELRHESENQAEGFGDHLVVDDIQLDCGPQCVYVTLPNSPLPYLDPLDWATEGFPMILNDDDCDPSTPFLWDAAPHVLVVETPFYGLSLFMENVARDQTQLAPHFTLVEQASTRIPHVTASSTRGYAVGAELRFVDGATTRAWFVGEAGAQEGQYRMNTGLLYSAGTATLWAQHPDAIDPIVNDPVWIDTGVSLGDLGIAFNQWFRLTIHRNLNGSFIFKINANVLRDSNGEIVRTLPLQSIEGGVHENLDRLFFLSGDDDTAPAGSILYADQIRAWSLPCLGDIYDDGRVTFADINYVLGSFNQPNPPGVPPNVAPDADNDGVADDSVVNFADLNAALSQYSNPCD